MKLKSVGKYLRYRSEIIRERRNARNHLIIVEPFGGLANRMRVIASGIWLKNKIEGDLVVIWSPDQSLNCPYELIFENNENFKIIRMNDYIKNVRATNQADWIETTKSGIVNKFMGIDYCIKECDFPNLIKFGKIDILEVARKNKVIYFQTCQEFGDGQFAYKSYKPISQIQEQIGLASKLFTASTIGIHIRRTDHDRSIKNSPIALFIEKMQGEISVNANTNFFLATDDSEVEKTMFDLFGPKIMTHGKKRSRNTVKGIQDAVVDLYCLSKTSKIMGSYWSSFSTAASRISQIELEIIQK